MDDVRAAVLLAKPVVCRSHVEDKNAPALRHVGGLQQCIRIEIGNDEGDASIRHLGNRWRGVLSIGKALLFDQKALLEKPTGRIVVDNGKFSAGQSVVFRG